MLKAALLAIVASIMMLAAVASTRPATYHVTRTTVIAAPPEKVFVLLDDYRKWADWSPWAKLDPAMKVTYDGPATGVGSAYSWVGNHDVGEGRMTTLESRPAQHLKIKLDFIKPFESASITDFTLTPQGRLHDEALHLVL